MVWNDDKSTASDPDNPAADEQLTADEWDNHVSDQISRLEYGPLANRPPTSEKPQGALWLDEDGRITRVNSNGTWEVDGISRLADEAASLGSLNIGPLQVPADRQTYPMANLPVTPDASAGDPVGYRLELDEDAIITITGEADGSGGVQSVQVAFNDTLLVDPANNVGADSMTADPESDSEDGYVEVEINGTVRQIPFYDS